LRITKKELYSEQDTLVDAVLRDMIKLPIEHVGMYYLYEYHSFPESVSQSVCLFGY